MVQVDFVKLPDRYVLHAHKKTTPIKHPDKDLIYNVEYTGTKNNVIKNILIDTLPISLKITAMIRNKDIYYADNYTGEIIRNWLHDCQQCSKIVK